MVDCGRVEFQPPLRTSRTEGAGRFSSISVQTSPRGYRRQANKESKKTDKKKRTKEGTGSTFQRGEGWDRVTRENTEAASYTRSRRCRVALPKSDPGNNDWSICLIPRDSKRRGRYGVRTRFCIVCPVGASAVGMPSVVTLSPYSAAHPTPVIESRHKNKLYRYIN